MVEPTKEGAERRKLSFSCFNCVLSDIAALGDDESKLRTTGQWSAGRIVQHIADSITNSIDGWPIKGPLVMRLIGPLLKRKIISSPMKPGFKIPKSMEALLPPDSTAYSTAVANLKAAIARATAEGMDEPHPVFGSMNNGQWLKLHCRHAEMHFSFMHPTE